MLTAEIKVNKTAVMPHPFCTYYFLSRRRPLSLWKWSFFWIIRRDPLEVTALVEGLSNLGSFLVVAVDFERVV